MARAAMLIACATALAMLTPAAASGQIRHGGSLAPGVGPGAISDEVIERFRDCPTDDKFPEGVGLFLCMHVKAYDGELKLGDVRATIDDPIEATVGIGLGEGGVPIVAMGGDEGEGESAGPAPVKISGGILGVPELDPVIDAEPLGLLSLSATPQIGALDAPGADEQGRLPHIVLPLSIKLNNTLFGGKCQIGTPEEPFVVNLITGTTAPPPGVAPISGDTGVKPPNEGWNAYGAHTLVSRVGARSVDNTFAVPGAEKCDLLVGDALDQPSGLFDPVINSIAGLPSPAGNNEMAISIDTYVVERPVVDTIRNEALPNFVTTEDLPDFGTVEVGQSATKTVTFYNPKDAPLNLSPGWSLIENELSPGGAGQFSIISDGCQGLTLQQGEQCDVEVRFSPTSPGAQYADLRSGNFLSRNRITLQGSGGGLLDAAGLDFGTLETGQSSTKTAVFENVSGEPVAIAGGAVFDGDAAAEWSMVADGCGDQTLAPGDRCEIEVRFAPQNEGDTEDKSVTLDLSNASSLVVGRANLKASSVYPITAEDLDVDTWEVGQSVDRTITFTNSGQNPAGVVQAHAVTSGSQGVSVIDDRCAGETVQPGQSCEVDIRVAPTSAGGLGTARVQLLGNGSVVLGQMTVGGSAVRPLTGTTLEFGTVTVGQPSTVQTATFTNTGSHPAVVSQPSVVTGTASRLASWQIVDDGCNGQTVQPDATCEVAVRFAPTSSGTKDVNLDVRGTDTLVIGRVALAGSGINP